GWRRLTVLGKRLSRWTDPSWDERGATASGRSAALGSWRHCLASWLGSFTSGWAKAIRSSRRHCGWSTKKADSNRSTLSRRCAETKQHHVPKEQITRRNICRGPIGVEVTYTRMGADTPQALRPIPEKD